MLSDTQQQRFDLYFAFRFLVTSLIFLIWVEKAFNIANNCWKAGGKCACRRGILRMSRRRMDEDRSKTGEEVMMNSDVQDASCMDMTCRTFHSFVLPNCKHRQVYAKIPSN